MCPARQFLILETKAVNIISQILRTKAYISVLISTKAIFIMASPLATLLDWATSGKLASCKVSDDGKTLTNGSTELDATAPINVEKDGKTCSYTIASIFLQILDPNQGLMAYRNACKKYDVKDPVKPLDKPIVVGYFGAEEEGAIVAEPVTDPTPAAASAAAAAIPMDDDEARKLKEYKDRKHAHKEKERRKEKERAAKEGKDHRKRDRDDTKHRKDDKKEDKAPQPKKPKPAMINEQVVANLSTVVDKREGGDQELSEVHKALSAEGFEVTPELIKESKIDHIVSYEIPVGNSASILRPAPGRDLTRVLQLYQEVKDRASSSSSSKAKAATPQAGMKSYLVGKKPVIVLPKGMTAPLTLVNAHEFFGNSNFCTREKMMQQYGRTPPRTVFTHTMDNRNGGGQVEFELMDNPKAKLGNDPREWERIVSVITLGASWQFKDWPRDYNDPVKLFQKAKGFYPYMTGDKVPVELQGWRVVRGEFNRDKRGLDSVCFATFWKELEGFMVVHKREMLPRKDV